MQHKFLDLRTYNRYCFYLFYKERIT